MRIVALIILVLVLGVGAWFAFFHEQREPPPDFVTNDTMQITSAAFTDGQPIPSQYTCDGGDTIPPLQWEGAPDGTKSFVLIVSDPDAPSGTFTHWLVQDIPATTSSIPEGGPAPGTEIPNSFARESWGGPCPPSGQHRYYFTLYALDVDAITGLNKDNVETILKPHVLADATLLGVYKHQ